jgi:hypothetical protein
MAHFTCPTVRHSSVESFVERDFFIRILLKVYFNMVHREYKHDQCSKALSFQTCDIKGRSPSNGKLSDFAFYIDSQKSAHRKFEK